MGMRGRCGWAVGIVLAGLLWGLVLSLAASCSAGSGRSNRKWTPEGSLGAGAPGGLVTRGGPERVGDVSAKPRLEQLRDPKAVADLIAAEKGRAKLQAETAKREAREDFAATVRRYTGIAMGILTAAAVAALLLSFVVPWVSTRSAAAAFAAVALLGLGRYALLRYGTLAADVTVVVSLGLAVVAALVIGLPMGISWARRKLVKQSEQLAAKGEPRPAVALWAAATGITGESAGARAERRRRLSKLEARGAVASLAALRPPGAGLDVDGSVTRPWGPAPVDREPAATPAPPPKPVMAEAGAS